MKTKICQNCKFWNNGTCSVLNNEVKIPDYSGVSGWCEGGVVEVEHRVSFFSIETGKNFGCVHFKKMSPYDIAYKNHY